MQAMISLLFLSSFYTSLLTHHKGAAYIQDKSKVLETRYSIKENGLL